MTDDAELLRRYAEDASEEAFAAIVSRYIGLVYGVALRQAHGNGALAEDVTQMVFIDLARKARSIDRQTVLAGWLHTATRFAAGKAIRAEMRRKAREQVAHADGSPLTEAAGDVEWARVQPALDEVLGELEQRERAALILRYFEGRRLAEIGARLSLTEDGARFLVERALEKTRALLKRRGVTSTSAALGLALANGMSVAAPAGLAASVTGAALGSSAAVAIGFMSMTKLVAGIATVAAISGLGFGLLQQRRTTTAELEVAKLRDENRQLAARMEQHAKRAATQPVLVSPSVMPMEPVRASVALPAAPQAEVAPWDIEATKEVLAHVRSSVGKVNLGAEEVAGIHAWVKQDAPGLIRWIASIPSAKQREHTTEAVIAVETETNPELAFLLANSIEDERPRMNRLMTVTRAWAAREPEAAARAVAAASLPEGGRERLLRALEASRGAAR